VIAPTDRIGDIVPVSIVKIGPNSLHGTLAGPATSAHESPSLAATGA
jgi:hypothetical protein